MYYVFVVYDLYDRHSEKHCCVVQYSVLVQTFVSAAVAQKDRPGGGPVEVAARAEFGPFWVLVDTRKSAACRIAPMEPCMWPTGFLDVMFPLVAPTPPLQVAPTHADQEMIRQHVDDTVLPWRCAPCCFERQKYRFEHACAHLSYMSFLPSTLSVQLLQTCSATRTHPHQVHE